jgi:hypothetical protein
MGKDSTVIGKEKGGSIPGRSQYLPGETGISRKYQSQYDITWARFKLEPSEYKVVLKCQEFLNV